jgi:hypothetical protein
MSSAYNSPSIYGIGYFVIHIKDNIYGIKSKGATALACSYDAVIDRIKKRGTHICPEFITDLSALELSDLFEGVLYRDKKEYKMPDNIGVLHNELSDIVYQNELLWVPDGDEAFDDGSRIIQFDIEQTVRLIGYKSLHKNKIDIKTLTDLTMDAEQYYTTLENWSNNFYNEWQKSVTRNYISSA